MTTDDYGSLAEGAGLRYVGPDAAGYRRVRRGQGFAFLASDGQTLNGRVRRRIKRLAIPTNKAS